MSEIREYQVGVKATQTIYRAATIVVRVVAYSQEDAEAQALAVAKRETRHATDLDRIVKGCKEYDVEEHVEVGAIDRTTFPPEDYDADLKAVSALDRNDAGQRLYRAERSKMEAAGQESLFSGSSPAGAGWAVECAE